MILGGGQPSTGSARPAPAATGWGLDNQQGKVWALLQEHPVLRTVPLPAAVLVEGWVSA